MSHRCSKCSRQAIAVIKYARLKLCREHFTAYIERKVESILRKYKLLTGTRKIVLAVSGGKDSMAMTWLLWRLAQKYPIKLLAINIDLGIGSYSKQSSDIVKKYSRELGIEYVIVRLKELVRHNIEDLSKLARRSTCSVCGLVKRYLLNLVALESKADYVALGHNLDDILAYSLKSFLSGDYISLVKFTPVTQFVNDIAVGRLRPLYKVYEREALLLALVNRIPFVVDECPLRPESSIEFRIKSFLNNLEEEKPGIKIQWINNLEKTLKSIQSNIEVENSTQIHKCKYCGLLSKSGICGFCNTTKKVLGKPLGASLRNIIKSLVEEKLFASSF